MNDQYLYIENENSTKALQVTFKFKLTGLALEDPDEDDTNAWTIDLGPEESVVKRFVSADQQKKKSGGGMGFGGFSGLGGMMDMYDDVQREFKILNTKAETYEG